MDKVRLGRTGMMVSKLGFGGIPIQRDSAEEAIAVVKRCLDLGITFIDTANAYTTSEERIGKAIAGRRHELIIASKTGHRVRDGVERHLKRSLEKLNVDYIDLYQFHQIGDFKILEVLLAANGPLEYVESQKKAGIIRHIGFSSHSMDVAKAAIKTDCFETIMFPFNFIADEAAAELMPLVREHDMGFIAMKPMAGGMLNSPTLPFKYLSGFPDIVPIVGIEKVHEIEEIMAVLAQPQTITPAERQEMQRIKSELGKTFCHRCDYCRPCTAEIPICEVMTSASYFKRMPPERFFEGYIAQSMEKASTCTECGECEPRCPYHLPIREMMAERAKWFQGAKLAYQTSKSA